MRRGRTGLWLAALGVAAAGRPARADTPGQPVSPASSYAMASLDVTMAGAMALQFTTTPSTGGRVAIGVAPLAISAGVAYLAYRSDWAPRPALAAHGAFFAGGAMFLAGALAAGSHEDPLEIGPLAIGAGVVGAIAGGWLGATQIDDDGDASLWGMAPWSMLALGALGGLVLALPQMGEGDGEGFIRVFGATVALGVAAGVGLGALAAGEDDDTPAPTTSVQPSASGVTLQYGGSF